MSLRELRVLVTHLPAESATARTLVGHSWRDEDYLLADIADSLRFYRVEYARAHGAKPPTPKPVTRPTPREQPKQVSTKEVAAAAHQHVLDQVLPHRPAVEEQQPGAVPAPEGE